jgi:hypothetical protein
MKKKTKHTHTHNKTKKSQKTSYSGKSLYLEVFPHPTSDVGADQSSVHTCDKQKKNNKKKQQ